MNKPQNYKVIGRDSNPKTVGVQDGAGQVFLNENFLDTHPRFKSIFYKNSTWTIDWWRKWIYWKEYGENLSHIKMHKKSIHTDYISTGILLRGFFVNNRLREILESFNLPSHHFFEATFNQEGVIIEGYWWFCFDIETGEKCVDFSECEFNFSYHKRNIDSNFSPTIKTYSDYMGVFYETGSAPKASKLVFNSNFDKNLDIWATQFLTTEVYISERLLNAIDDSNITGFISEYSMIEIEFVE